jgi:hypothetical protein
MAAVAKMGDFSSSDGFESVFEDPISFEIMDKAVMTPCGHSFSESTIVDWLQHSNCCPLCNRSLSLREISPNYKLREAICKYLKLKEQYQRRKGKSTIGSGVGASVLQNHAHLMLSTQSHSQPSLSIKEDATSSRLHITGSTIAPSKNKSSPLVNVEGVDAERPASIILLDDWNTINKDGSKEENQDDEEERPKLVVDGMCNPMYHLVLVLVLTNLSFPVVQARSLRNKNLIGKSNPFVVIKFQKQKRQSSVMNGNLNPVWNETFVL